MPPLINLTNQTFGRLTVKKKSNIKKCDQICWECICTCGAIVTIKGCDLRCGNTKSCGCIKKEQNFVHGMVYIPEYRVWAGMIKRCYNPSDTSFKNYGGRGIKVYDKWRKSFSEFFNYIGTRPTQKHTIERINNNEGYFPDNVKWATTKEQVNNRRNNHVITIHGWTMNLCQWAEFAGISQKNLGKRINVFGWPPAKAIFTPIRHR